MTDGVSISLERFILEKMKAFECRWNIQLAALRAEMDLKLAASAKALELQANEYERRLTDLNHAHDLAKDTLQTYTPRGEFARVERDVRNLELANADRLGVSRVVVVIVALGSALAGSVLGALVGKIWPG